LPAIGDTPRNRVDFEWQKLASQIADGGAVKIPIPPLGWKVELPAASK
jgi:hypothetical protein